MVAAWPYSSSAGYGISRPACSVIGPVCRLWALAPELLECLEAQFLQNVATEVLLVDNGVICLSAETSACQHSEGKSGEGRRVNGFNRWLAVPRSRHAVCVSATCRLLKRVKPIQQALDRLESEWADVPD